LTAVFGAAVARVAVAVVAQLDAFEHAVAAGVAGLAGHGAFETPLDLLAAGGAAVAVGAIAVVALFGAFRDAVAALLAARARHDAVEPFLDVTVRRTAVAVLAVAVVAGLARVDVAVTAAVENGRGFAA
jgi:hypothetical protein